MREEEWKKAAPVYLKWRALTEWKRDALERFKEGLGRIYCNDETLDTILDLDRDELEEGWYYLDTVEIASHVICPWCVVHIEDCQECPYGLQNGICSDAKVTVIENLPSYEQVLRELERCGMTFIEFLCEDRIRNKIREIDEKPSG